jgi:glucosamine--fructose-6-phosphate aminotransferase (isomerizing)
MNSIDAMETEIRYQVENLSKSNLPKQTNLSDCMFIGSGDSYVAALIAQYASNHKVICCNPMDIVLNPEIAKNRRIYIVSISGNTKANILAAKIAKEQNVWTTAVTANPESKLAKSCDEIMEVQYKTTGIPTSGTISFTSSMLSCLSLVSEVNDFDNLKMIYRETKNEVESLIIDDDNDDDNILENLSSYIFLGDGILFPVAIYGALKVNEVFGSKSFAYPLEEFCHSPIFSIKRNDKIMILGNKEYVKRINNSNSNSRTLNDRLEELDFSSCFYTNCSSSGGNKLSLTEMLLKSIFFLQLYIVKQAIIRGVKDCYFLQNKDILKLSSFFIYDMC